ncbi:MAG: hypothetical protein U0872_16265 [Planctomycetaceae bacterium]
MDDHIGLKFGDERQQFRQQRFGGADQGGGGTDRVPGIEPAILEVLIADQLLGVGSKIRAGRFDGLAIFGGQAVDDLMASAGQFLNDRKQRRGVAAERHIVNQDARHGDF